MFSILFWGHMPVIYGTGQQMLIMTFLLENNLLHKPNRIFSSDETGFGDKCDNSREKGIFKKGSKFP